MLDNLDNKQKKIVIIVGIIIIIGILYFIYNGIDKKSTDQIDNNMLSIENNTKENEGSKELVIVHITGAVKTPGIVKLPEGARIEDAIDKAGGLTEDADISDVNLAYVLEDGIKIKIPTISEEKNEEIIINSSGEGIVEKEISNNSENKIININKANETDLQTLPGIGASLAGRIVEYRNSNGKFNEIEDIKNVSGIGDSKYENIKNLICVK
jgi:competence protein ComEA